MITVCYNKRPCLHCDYHLDLTRTPLKHFNDPPNENTEKMPRLSRTHTCAARLFLAGLAVLGLLGQYPEDHIRNTLADWSLYGISACLTVALLGIVLGFADIRRQLTSISFGGFTILLVILIVAFLLSSRLVPQAMRIYFDEHIYENIAQSILHTGQAFLVDEGDAEAGAYRIYSRQYNKQPNAWPAFQALLFRFFGVAEDTTHLATNLAFVAGLLALWLLIYLLFQSEAAAHSSALVLGLTPVVLRWSNTASVEIAAAAFATLGLAAHVYYMRKASWPSMLISAGFLSYATYYRPESLLVFIVAILFSLVLNVGELKQRRFSVWLTLSFLLCLPELVHLYAVRNEGWGSSYAKFQLFWAFVYIKVNGPYYFNNAEYPLLFTILALLGALSGKVWRLRLPIICWFVIMCGLFLFFYCGGYKCGVSERFAVLSMPPLAALAGLGMAELYKLFPRGPYFRKIATTIALLVFIIMLRPFGPYVRAVGTEAIRARKAVWSAKQLAKTLPPKSMVLSHTPSMWLVWGYNSAHTNRVCATPDYFQDSLQDRYPGGIYLDYGYWCNVPDPEQNAMCECILDKFETEVQMRFSDSKSNFVLYKLISLK